MSEYFGIVARGPSGSTAAMELVNGREAAAIRAEELLESGHEVSLYKCVSVSFEIRNAVTIDIHP